MKSSSKTFSDSIKANTKELSNEIYSTLKLESNLAVPSDLRGIFTILEFITAPGRNQVPLSCRGDGIKSRHIPAILRFIHEQDNRNKRQGAPRITTIWGYEEPENNLELSAAVDSAKKLYEYSGEIQMLITTHSPAFYSIDKHEEFVGKNFNILRVRRDEKTGILLSHKGGDLLKVDLDMGTLPLFENPMQQLYAIKKELGQLKREAKCSHIIVEGNEDRIIFEKAIDLFSKKLKKQLDEDKLAIIASDSGCSGVVKRATSFVYRDDFKCYGILDMDAKDKSFYLDFKENPACKRASDAKRVALKLLTPPSEHGKIRRVLLDFYLELEDLYTSEAWQYAESKGYLVPRKISISTSHAHKSPLDLVRGQFTSNSYLQKVALNTVKNNKKIVLASWVVRQKNAKLLLQNFKSIVLDMERFFL